jgi:hypothetical protein
MHSQQVRLKRYLSTYQTKHKYIGIYYKNGLPFVLYGPLEPLLIKMEENISILLLEICKVCFRAILQFLIISLIWKKMNGQVGNKKYLQLSGNHLHQLLTIKC